jgi:phage pi2 protein 07
LLNGKTLFVTKAIEGEKERNGKASWSTNDVQNKSWSTDEKTVVTIWKHPQQQKDYLPPQLRGKKIMGH